VSGFLIFDEKIIATTIKLAHAKISVGSPSCKAGKWLVDFRSDGLALYKNGVAIFGGEKQLIAAKEVSNSNVKSQAWVE
jgi:hypothetical protein